MSKSSCDIVSELLVDYSDGELEADDSRRVQSHLAECQSCRARADRLEQSLEAAQSFWKQAEADAARVQPRAAISRPWKKLPLAASLAAAIAAAVVLAGLYGLPDSGEQTHVAQVQKANSIGNDDGVFRRDDNEQGEVEVEDEVEVIEAMIAREVRAARLAVSAQLLANEPELAEYKEAADRYLAQVYGSNETRDDPPQTTSENGT